MLNKFIVSFIQSNRVHLKFLFMLTLFLNKKTIFLITFCDYVPNPMIFCQYPGEIYLFILSYII